MTNSPAYSFLLLVEEFKEAIRGTSTDVTTVFHTWAYDFIEIYRDTEQPQGKETSQNELKLQFSWRQFQQ